MILMQISENAISLETKLFELIAHRSNVFKSIVCRPTIYRLIVFQKFNVFMKML